MSGVSLVIVLIHHQGWHDAWWFVMIHDDTWWYLLIHDDAWWFMTNDACSMILRQCFWEFDGVGGNRFLTLRNVAFTRARMNLWVLHLRIALVFQWSELHIWSLKCRKNWCFWVEIVAKRNVLNFQWSENVIRWVFSKLSDFNVNDWEVGSSCDFLVLFFWSLVTFILRWLESTGKST